MSSSKADKVNEINKKFSGSFTNSNFNDDGGAAKAEKITKKVDKTLNDFDADIQLSKEILPAAKKPRASRAKSVPDPETGLPPAKRQKTAPKATPAPSPVSKKAASAVKFSLLLDQYEKYLAFCRKHKIKLPDGLKACNGSTKEADLIATIRGIEHVLDSRDADGMVQTQCVMAITAIEKIVMQPPIYRAHRLNLHGLASAVDRSWEELFAELGEEFAIKYNLFFKAPIEVRFLMKIGMVAKALHEYNSGGPQFRQGVDAGEVEINPGDFPSSSS